MPKYMLLLHDNPAGVCERQPRRDAEGRREVHRLGQEAAARRASCKAGDKLTDEPGRVMRRKDGQVRVTDGPYSESKEVLGGYYMIEADSYEKAVELRARLPAARYGGTIEVRQVDVM